VSEGTVEDGDQLSMLEDGGMTARESFLWRGYTYAQMQAWKREREELRNGEELKFLSHVSSLGLCGMRSRQEDMMPRVMISCQRNGKGSISRTMF
jgi:hypothetical protein